MESGSHSIDQLFAQLGLPSDESSINAFVSCHALAPELCLSDAPFWSLSQAAFLKDEIAEDADWAGVVDVLNARLHGQG